MIKKAVLLIIKTYQRTLSPDHGFLKIANRGCRFYPSCSVYFYQAVDKYGILRGCGLGFKRILKCHPFSAGGIDRLN